MKCSSHRLCTLTSRSARSGSDENAHREWRLRTHVEWCSGPDGTNERDDPGVIMYEYSSVASPPDSDSQFFFSVVLERRPLTSDWRVCPSHRTRRTLLTPDGRSGSSSGLGRQGWVARRLGCVLAVLMLESRAFSQGLFCHTVTSGDRRRRGGGSQRQRETGTDACVRACARVACACACEPARQ